MHSPALQPRHGYMPLEIQQQLVASFNADPLDQPRTLAERCAEVLPYFAELAFVQGEDNIPPADIQVVVIKNHPGNLDTRALLFSLFKQRPDIIQVAKDSPITRQLPEEHSLLLRKDEDGHAHPDDITALQALLQNGGSMITTPWGALDHEAIARGATAAQAAMRTRRYLEHCPAGAVMLPISLTLDNTDPFRIARIEIGKPVAPNPDGSLNIDEINLVVTGMFNRHVRDAGPDTWPWEPGRRPVLRWGDEGSDILFHIE